MHECVGEKGEWVAPRARVWEREKERVVLAGKREVQAVINNLFSARTLLGKWFVFNWVFVKVG